MERVRLLLLCLLSLAGGCSTGTDPGPCLEVECRRITHFTSISWGTQEFGDSLIPYFRAEATFRREGGIVDQIRPAPQGIEVSSVRLNGIYLDEFIEFPMFSSGGIYFRREDIDPDSILAPPGELNRWVIRGRNSLDSLIFTIPTPAEPARITTDPAIPYDTLDLDVDLKISWPPATHDGEHRNIALVFLYGPDAFRIVPIDTGQAFSSFTDVDNITLPKDSLQVWRDRFTFIEVGVEHITVQDFRLNENEWGRALFSEGDRRRIYFPVN